METRDDEQRIIESFLEVQREIHELGTTFGPRQLGDRMLWLLEEADRFGQQPLARQIIGKTRQSSKYITVKLSTVEGLTNLFRDVIDLVVDEEL